MQNTRFRVKDFLDEKDMMSLLKSELNADITIMYQDVLFIGEDCETQLFGDRYDDDMYGIPRWSSEYVEYYYQIAGTNALIVVGITIPDGEKNEIDPIELAGRKISRNEFEIRKETVQYEPDKSKRMCDFDWVDKLAKQYKMNPETVLKIGNNETFYMALSKYYFDIKDPLTYALLQGGNHIPYHHKPATISQETSQEISKFLEDMEKYNPFNGRTIEEIEKDISDSLARAESLFAEGNVFAGEERSLKTEKFQIVPIDIIKEKYFDPHVLKVMREKRLDRDIEQYILESYLRGPQNGQKVIPLSCANKNKYSYEINWTYKEQNTNGGYEEKSIPLFASTNSEDIMKYIKANANVFSRDEFGIDSKDNNPMKNGKITINPMELMTEIDMSKSVADFISDREFFRENDLGFKIGDEEINNQVQIYDFDLDFL
jgi:hypothetical protein